MGSYVSDFVAKTPVREIRIIDGDEFLQHNAFHAPGAPCIDQLREAPRKVDYLSGIYSNMHKGIDGNSRACLWKANESSFEFVDLDK